MDNESQAVVEILIWLRNLVRKWSADPETASVVALVVGIFSLIFSLLRVVPLFFDTSIENRAQDLLGFIPAIVSSPCIAPLLLVFGLVMGVKGVKSSRRVIAIAGIALISVAMLLACIELILGVVALSS